MTKLSNKLINLVQKEDNKFFNVINYIKEKLLKIHNSDIVRPKDKNLILKKYSSFDELGKSAYKYFKLKDNELYNDAQKEFDNISNVVLKGGVTNTVFVWHSEFGEHTCDDCASLDGTQYTLEDDIPDSLHPNCKCYIEIVEFDGAEEGEGTEKTTENRPKKNKNDEPCDCWDKIDALVDETNEWKSELDNLVEELDEIYQEDIAILYDIKNFKSQVENLQINLKDIKKCGDNCIAYIKGMAIKITDDKNLEDIFEKISNLTDESKQVYQIFLEHKHEMEEARDGMDKYYHAKANCTSAELGYMQTLWAILFSILKEFKDFVYKVFKYHMNFKDVAKDCMQDLKADLYGIQKAQEHGYCSDKVKDVYIDVFNKK